MADQTINQLTEETTPASGDFIPLWKTASGVTRKVSRANLVGATLTGGGTIATGGNTLTVPATGTAALKDVAQTFTKTQTIQPDSSSADGLVVNMPSGSAEDAIEAQYNGTLRALLQVRANVNQLYLLDFDNGSNRGSAFIAGRNRNASTPVPGAFVSQRASDGALYSIYIDNFGIWRTLDAIPTNATFASGTVVGSQTSHIAFKEILGDPVSDDDALAYICAAAAQVARFVYKNGRFNGEEFSGIVLDGPELNRYGMDADPDHPAGKSLNVINAIGDLFLAVRGLAARVAELEAQLAQF